MACVGKKKDGNILLLTVTSYEMSLRSIKSGATIGTVGVSAPVLKIAFDGGEFRVVTSVGGFVWDGGRPVKEVRVCEERSDDAA